MKKYEKYKDSGFDWIGEIPEHWEIDKLGWQGIFSASGIDKKTVKGEPLVKMINYTDIYGNENLTLTADKKYMIVSCPKNKKDIHQVNVGDLIFTPSSETADEIGLSALVVDEMPDTVYSYHVIRLQITKDFDIDFRKYLCNNNFVLNQFSKEAKGTTRQIIGRDVFKNIKVLIPPKPEQTAIANYLNRKTAQIDQLIADKKRLLQLYEEEKTAIINQAVTKGIPCKDARPCVSYKDSGIEWLGKIPEHWKVKKLKYFVKKIGSGVTPRGGASVYLTSGIPLLRSQNIHFDGLRLDDVAYISNDTHNEMSNSKVISGDVLLNITGASIGRCYYITEALGEANVNQHVCIIRPNKKLCSQFLYYILRSFVGQVQIKIEQTGSGREGLNFEALKNFIIPETEIDEQTAIVQYIEKEIARINAKVGKAKKLIELLEEYRTALISEVVTGKIKVTE